MKRTLAALALVISMAPATALPQSSIISQIAGDKAASESLYFSLSVGLNVAYLNGSGVDGRAGGFNTGLSATIRLTDRLSVSPGVTLFSRKGISNIPFITTGDEALDPYFADPDRADLALGYVDIPVVVEYRLGRFSVGAGPFVGLLGSATERFRADLGTGEKLRFTRDVKAAYRSFDGGLVFEGAWTVTRPRRGMGLVVHFRYQAGLTNVRREYSGPLDAIVMPPGPVRNSVFQVFVSFPFVR
ncbi:MAG: PorT family protein [Candidatus Aminicenantes bacterium]|nr:MAG: PorT family protein [Candidatus Aminicenantes bacterium]